MTPRAYQKGHPLSSGRKISETLLDFASPLLEDMPPDASGKQIQEVLMIGCTVWNAVVLDDVLGGSHYIGMVMHQMKGTVLGSIMVSNLIDRKRDLFGEDHRLIGDYRVTRKEGELRVWAEARDPRGLGSKTTANQAPEDTARKFADPQR
jgi:hypothetical protein